VELTDDVSSTQAKAGRHKASPYTKRCSVGAIPCGRPDLSQDSTPHEMHPEPYRRRKPKASDVQKHVTTHGEESRIWWTQATKKPPSRVVD
jgi:hypothetical protein